MVGGEGEHCTRDHKNSFVENKKREAVNKKQKIPFFSGNEIPTARNVFLTCTCSGNASKLTITNKMREKKEKEDEENQHQ